MGIVLGSNFDVQTALPLDARTVVADATARDAIDSLIRYEGLTVYVVADATNYQLVGGITNGDWVELAGAGGAGGGVKIEWIEKDNAPVFTYVNAPLWTFDATYAQKLFSTIIVPSTYQVGNPIGILGKMHSTGSSGNVLFKIEYTLIRTGTDAISSTTNQEISANTAITLSGATIDIPQAIDFSLAVDGQIDGVAVNPGDVILLRLYRDTDTATAQASFIDGSEEVYFA